MTVATAAFEKDSSVLGHINALLAELEGAQRKQASTELSLSSGAHEDPGGYKGESTHPSAKVESGTGKASLGNRAQENEEEVSGAFSAAVDNTEPGSGGSQDDKQMHVGMHSSAVGDDPKVEDDYKGNKADPGTTHPANAEEVGGKYASVRDTDQLIKLAYAKLNDILAELGSGASLEDDTNTNNKQATHQYHHQQQQQPSPAAAAHAGYQAYNSGHHQLDKEAMASNVLAQVINEAEQDADNVAQYLHGRVTAWAKAAQPEGGPMPGEPPPPLPPEMMMGGGGGGGDPSMMMPPPGAAPPPAGGPPPEASPPPPGSPEAGGGGGGGGGDHEAAIEELANALIEMGVPPEELLQAAQQAAAGGGGGGGGPGAGAELPPEMAGAGAEAEAAGAGMPPVGKAASYQQRQRYYSHRVASMANAMAKSASAEDNRHIAYLANDVISLRNRGRLKIKSADSPRGRAEREEIKSYIKEVCGLRSGS